MKPPTFEEPKVPENISISMLSREIRDKLKDMPEPEFDKLAKHIITAQFFLDSNPKLAFEHAKYALVMAEGLDIAHEMLGICAYRLGLYKLALRELTIARSRNEYNDFVPMIIDCFRGIGDFDRALEIAERMEREKFAEEVKTEFYIILAACKADHGDFDSAYSILNRELRLKGLSTSERVRLFEAKSELLERQGKNAAASELEAKVIPILEKLSKTYEESFVVYDLNDELDPKKQIPDSIDDITEPRV